MVESVIGEVSQEFTDYIKKTLNKDMKINAKIYPKDPLHDDILGGVVLYCNGFKTVFDNSLRVRLNLSFEESIPDIRRIMFKSLEWLI